MVSNMGSPDKIIRLVVAFILILLIGLGEITGLAAIIAGVVSAIFIITSAISFCPIYAAVGVSTKRKIHTEKIGKKL